ncbi:hypothetical protein M8J75_008211 [Diaphorina citri]|nr:hypothetical protein M8J75_008211 [Diaphorina citri]
MDRFHPYRLSYSHVARSNIDRRVSRTRSRGGQGWRGRLQGRSFHIPGQRYEQGDYHRAGQGYQAYEEQELVYRGQGVARRGQGVARRGQGVARRGQGVARRGQGVVQQGQGVARRGQGVARGGQGVARGGQGVARRGQGVARRGQGVARRGQGVARQGQGVARRGQGVVGRGRGARRSRVSSGQVNRRIPKTAVEAFHILFGKGKVRKTLDVDVDSNIKVVLKFEGFTAEGIGQVEAEAEEQSYINLLEILVFDAKRKGEDLTKFQGFALMKLIKDVEMKLNKDEEEGQPEPLAIFKLFFPSSRIDTFEEEGNHVAECTMRGVRISHRDPNKDIAVNEVANCAVARFGKLNENYNSSASVEEERVREGDNGWKPPGDFELAGDSNALRLEGIAMNTTLSRSGATMADISTILKQRETLPTNLILCIGTNDVTRLFNAPRKQGVPYARKKEQFIEDGKELFKIMAEKGVKTAIFIESPRTVDIKHSEELFDVLRGQLTSQLESSSLKAVHVGAERMKKICVDGKILHRDRKHFHPDFIPKLRKYIEKIFLDMSACTMLQEVNME